MTVRRRVSSYSPFTLAFGYSRAVIEDPFVFISGTKGFDYSTMEMPIDISQQTRNAWETIAAVLTEADSDLSEIVKATVYVVDPSDMETVMRICSEVLVDVQPALSVVCVKALLRDDMKVEIEATAMWRVETGYR